MSNTVELNALYPAHLATLTTRVAESLSLEGFDSLVIHSGFQRMTFLDDQAYPFHVNPHFNWWVPLTDAPRCLLHVQPGQRPILAFHSAADYWHKPAHLPDAPWTTSFDIRNVESAAAARSALPPSSPRTAFVGEPFDGLDAFGYTAINPASLLRRLHEHRVRKTDYELHCLREASLRGARGHKAAEQAFAQGESEYGIHQAFLAGCQHREQELPYQAIVALNENAAILHYQSLDRTPPPYRHTLLIDAGADHNGYPSDITRTYAAQPGEFAALLTGLESIQQVLCTEVKAGTDWRELHLTAHRHIAALLQEADIIRMSPEAALEAGLSGVFLPHGLGHLLGLQVHDVAGFHPAPDQPAVAPPAGHGSLRLTRVLEPGFVVTVEPGIYFIDLLLNRARTGPLADAINWPLIDTLRPYGGIRIEDNLVVTTSAPENLTRSAFHQLAQ